MALTILKIIIILLILFFILLLKKFHLQKIRFQSKEERLINTMHLMQKKQINLHAKIKLSDDFDKTYDKSRNEIAQSIYETNAELFKKISDKNKTTE
jgi:predicted Holliday junction resolvase-like endonuclease